jgi:hypothetical protein
MITNLAVVFFATLAFLALVSKASPSPAACDDDRATSAVMSSPFRAGQAENLTPVNQAAGRSGVSILTVGPWPSYAGAKLSLAYNQASLCKPLGGHRGFRYDWVEVENEETANSISIMYSPVQSGLTEWLANVSLAVAGDRRSWASMSAIMRSSVILILKPLAWLGSSTWIQSRQSTNTSPSLVLQSRMVPLPRDLPLR